MASFPTATPSRSTPGNRCPAGTYRSDDAWLPLSGSSYVQRHRRRRQRGWFAPIPAISFRETTWPLCAHNGSGPSLGSDAWSRSEGGFWAAKGGRREASARRARANARPLQRRGVAPCGHDTGRRTAAVMVWGTVSGLAPFGGRCATWSIRGNSASLNIRPRPTRRLRVSPQPENQQQLSDVTAQTRTAIAVTRSRCRTRDRQSGSGAATRRGRLQSRGVLALLRRLAKASRRPSSRRLRVHRDLSRRMAQPRARP